MLNYVLRQIRKRILNSMNALYGISLWKSSNKHKVEGKGYYHERKKIEYKHDFKKFHDGNIGMKHLNNFCKSNNYADLKFEIEEVNAFQIEKPNWQLL